MNKNKKRLTKTIVTSTLATVIVLPTVVSCGVTNNTSNKNSDNVTIIKPTYASLGIKGFDGEAKITHLPYSPREGVLISVSKKKELKNQDKITITYIVDNKSNLTINGQRKVVFEYFVHGLKKKPIKNINIQKPTYASLGIVGESGNAKLMSPPKGNMQFNVLINRKDNIKNNDVIEITFVSADPSKYSINGKERVIFSYTVHGLFEPQKVVDLKISKADLAINVTGDNGKGEFTVPKIKHTKITVTQNQNLSNGQNFTVTVRGEKGYSINGKSEESFTYTVSGLKDPIINQIVAKPNIVFRGFNGSGTFNIPNIPNMTVTADKTTGLSNNDQVTLTITANNGYKINGKDQEVIKYQVSGLAAKVPQANVEEIKPKKQGYNINELKHKTVMNNGQKTLIAWFGKTPADSPLVFMFGYIMHDSKFIKNAPTVEKPYINENELEEFVKLFLTRIVHGPELPSLGVITFDNKHMIDANPHLGGYVIEGGLSLEDKRKDIPEMPKNPSKTLLFINSRLGSWENALNNNKPNFNGVRNKFDNVFLTLQHEYGHVLNHFQTWQKPVFVGRHKKVAPNELIQAGLQNGYRPNRPQNKYMSKYLLEKLAGMLGVDVNDPDVNRDTVLVDLLKEKREIRNKNGDETFVNKQLALWTLRIMVGDFDDKLPGYINRNKAFIYKGKKADPNFYVNYHRFGFDHLTGAFKYLTAAQEITIWDDYSSGYDEMLTRMFTNMFSKPKTYKIGATTLASLLVGWEPYYTYKKNAFNFSSETDGKNPGDWMAGFINSNSWLKNGVETDGKGMTFYPSFSSDAKNLIKDGEGFRVPVKDTTKRDKMIEFWRDTIMGHNKVISTFIKESNELVRTKGELTNRQPWSMNIIGGWTKQQHQYLILNPKDTKEGIIDHKSTAFSIQDAHGYLAFRGNPDETWENRTINYNKKSAWYVDFSERYGNLVKMQKHLKNQKFSFWDDNNKDGIVQKDEITLIPWSDVRTLYPQSGRVFSGGSNQGNWNVPSHLHVDMEQIGETWTNSWSDLLTALMLKRTKGNSVQLAEEIYG